MKRLTNLNAVLAAILLLAFSGSGLANETVGANLTSEDRDNPTVLVCEPPTGIEAQATGPESIYATWQPAGDEVSWELQYGAVGFDHLAEEGTIVSAGGSPEVSVSSLTPESTYEIYVRSVCESPTEFSDWVGPIEVTTACQSVSLDYLQSFDSVLPLCWAEAGDGNPTDGPQLLGESDWIADDFMDNNASDAIRLHVHSNSDNEWLFSPFVSLTTEELCEVSLDIGVKEFLGSASSMGSDDQIQLLIRLEGESNWTNIETWDSSFESPVNGQNFSFDITSYANETVQFAIWVTDGAIDDPENNKVFIDNFQVKEVATCPAVTDISTTAIDPYSASLTWQPQGIEELWNVALGTTGFEPLLGEGEVFTVSGTPEILFEDFAPGATYQVYVQAVCIEGEDSSDWTGPFTFTTPCGVEFPEYVQDFTFFVPNCWVKAGNGSPSLGPSQFGAGGWVSDFYMENTNTDAARLMLNSNTSQEWLISPEIELTAGTEYQLDFDFGILFADDETAGNLGTDDEFRVLISLDDGDSWTTLATVDNSYSSEEGGEMLDFNLATYEGETVRFALWGTDGSVLDTPARTIYIDNFRVREVPSCPEPADLAYYNVSITTANLSWEVTGDEDQWTVSYGPPGYDPNGSEGTEVTANTNFNYQLTDLTTSTPYDVYVRAECIPGEDVSLWDGPVSFETLCQTSPITEYPYYEDFDEELPPAIPCGWWEENTNGDLFSWETSDIYGYSEPNALFIRYNDVQFVAMDDWVFSPEMVMSTSQTYTLTFKYKTGGENFSENLGIFLCETDDSESVISELIALEGISNLQYETAQVSFEVDADASYHIGFHGYSGNGEFYIAVDDVRVCDVPSADVESDAISVESLPSTIEGELNACFSNSFGSDDPDKFYTFTAPECTDSIDVSLCNSDFDTRLSLVDSEGNVLDVSDNAEGCGLQSACYGVEVIPGNDYTIVIEGVNGATGNYELAIDLYQTFENPAFSFEAGEFCINEILAVPEVMGTEGGTFSGATGLVIDPITGEVDLEATGPGVFAVTYTTSDGPCGASETKEIEILPMPSAEFSLADDTLCVYFDPVFPDLTGDPGGEFSSGTGLAIDPSTGEIDPAESEIGSYVVSYEVTIDGCTSTSQQQVVIDLCTNVGERVEVDFSVYPNPTDREISITLRGVKGDFFMEIYDLTGKVLFAKELTGKNSQVITLPHLSEGIYMLKIEGNKTSNIKKLLIDR